MLHATAHAGNGPPRPAAPVASPWLFELEHLDGAFDPVAATLRRAWRESYWLRMPIDSR
jgi:hypothetical protein